MTTELRPTSKGAIDRASLIVWLALGLLTLCVFMDYGISFDEPRQKTYGDLILSYFDSGGEDIAALTYINLYYYGGLFDAGVHWLHRETPLGRLGIYEARHLCNALVGLLGILGVWRLGRELGGARTGLIALILIALTPTYVGHSFNNPKDIPFAAGYVWSIYFLLRLARTLPRTPWLTVGGLALALGCSLGVRIGAALLVIYTLMVAGAHVLLPRWLRDPGAFAAGEPRWRDRLLGTGLRLAPAFGIAFLLMIALWPWAREAPFEHPFKALEFMSKFGDWPGTVLLNGDYVEAGDLPDSYLFHYLAVKLPELILFALAGGVVMLGTGLIKGRFLKQREYWVGIGLVLFATVFPPVYAILSGAVLYDGMRHFIFCLPLLAVLAALAIEVLLQRTRGRVRAAVYTGVGIGIASMLFEIVQLHPNQYVYYNLLAGGTRGAQERYEMDYWANSYKEAVEIVEARARERDGDAFETTQYRVNVEGPYLSAIYYFPENFIHEMDVNQAEFTFSHTRWGIHTNLPGQCFHEIRRRGALLTVIHEIAPPPAAP